jgi:uncharacterized protein (DUF2236 family)
VRRLQDRELGDDYISQILNVSAPRPLKEIAHDILRFARTTVKLLTPGIR